MQDSKERIRVAAARLSVVLGALALAACGSSGGSGAGSSLADNPGVQNTQDACTDDGSNCGTLMLALTDADGDLVSYTVDVDSITLHRANGATVEMLPAAMRVDFTQLSDLSDLIKIATLPPGDFDGGTIRLDFSNAEIDVEQNGQLVAAKAVDVQGQPLGVTDLEIQLADRDHLVLTRGRAALLSLDFDLAASNDVDLSQTPPVVTVRPYIVADVEPVDQKDMRVRGGLVDVDTAASTYTVDLRPWQLKDGDHGSATVHTTADTSFEINGVAATGADGIKMLDALPAGTLTVAFGTLDISSHEFTAQTVDAGDSVQGQGLDAAEGSVVAREGDQLKVEGAFAVGPGFDARFHRSVIVDLGPDTKVSKVGDTDPLDASAVSVGQKIVAFGKLTLPSGSAAEPPTLDATSGRIRLLVSKLHGIVNSVSQGQLDLKLNSIDRLGIEMFDFTGTGKTPAEDADPANYEVVTSTLGLATIAPNQPAKVLGFVTPFGSAPPDFNGNAVVDQHNLLSTLVIGWGESGTTAPFLSIENTGLVLDLATPSIGHRHFLTAGGKLIDLLGLPASPTIVPSDGHSVYGLWERGHVELFSDFSAFVAALSSRLTGSSSAVSMTASGRYDEGSNVLTANRIAVYFNSPQAVPL
ncbi:MAG TPA: hypothetical protein VFY39_17565 [Gammaproteobacteria bacterium]|nr:hypothetical protein [Gammaproteobacteria bacterium]